MVSPVEVGEVAASPLEVEGVVMLLEVEGAEVLVPEVQGAVASAPEIQGVVMSLLAVGVLLWVLLKVLPLGPPWSRQVRRGWSPYLRRKGEGKKGQTGLSGLT